MNMRDLARSVRSWRHKMNLTQQQAAEQLELSQSTVAMVEAGHRRLRRATAERVAKVVGHGG